MSTPIAPTDVVVGLLTENTTRMLSQTTRLLRSIRWFGGKLAESRIVVCTVGRLGAESERELCELGAEVRVVSRFHPANPTANRHQLIAELLDAPESLLFLLDCDTIIARDPLPFLDGVNFQAKIAPTPTVNDAVFERLFSFFGIPKPPRSYVTGLDGTPTVPYFNGGVLAMPRAIARTLAPVWRRYNQVLADRPELVAPCQRHMHQASLTLALVETGVPCRELPLAMNFQINATHVAAPRDWATTDPVIVHYHHLATDDGLLLPCPYPAVQARIEAFNDRAKAEGLGPTGAPAPRGVTSRPVLVLGMHRSGTSLLAQLVRELGAYAGAPDELTPSDMFNPTGFWELKAVVALNEEILATLGATVTDCASADSSRLPAEARRRFLDRAAKVTDTLRGSGPCVLKDPRIALLVPFWREVLGDPVCVIVWRHPSAVARSLQTREQRSRVWSLALWEHYNRTVIRDTEGLTRVLVSYEEILADPERATRDLHAQLAAAGVEGLTLPDRDAIFRIVNDDFNRSGRVTNGDETLLDADQRALLSDLRSGAALRGIVAETSPRTLELLRELGRAETLIAGLRTNVVTLRRTLGDRDQLIRSVFESRSWRVGHGMSKIVRSFAGPDPISAVDQWERLKRESEG
jgi:hypothetical protein